MLFFCAFCIFCLVESRPGERSPVYGFFGGPAEAVIDGLADGVGGSLDGLVGGDGGKGDRCFGVAEVPAY